MFRAARLLRGMSPYSLFLIEQRSNPALQGLSIADRGRETSKLYRQLSAKEKEGLKNRADRKPAINTKRANRNITKKTVSNGKKSEFSRFVKQNYAKVQALPPRRRFAALSALYNVSKPINVEAEMKKLARSSSRKSSTAEEPTKTVASAKKSVKRASKKKK